MTSRFARLCSAGLVLMTALGARAQAPASPTTALPASPPVGPAAVRPASASSADEPVILKLPDADLETVLSALEIYTGKIILRPSQLPLAPGGYNLKISKPIPKSQAILYIETILAMNNIAVIPMGTDALKVVPLPQARVEAPKLIEGSTLGMPPSSKVASKLFQLDFLRVQEFQQMLQTITNPNFGTAIPLANANAILVTDTISNLQRIETLLQQVDRPYMTGMSTKFYQLRNGAKASDVVAKLHAILTGTLQQQIGMGTSFNADDRTNQIILISDPRQFPFFDNLIEKLDVTSAPNTENKVIYLKHAKAADVAAVLIKIISGQNQATQKNQLSATPLQPTTPTPTAPPGQPAAAPRPTIVSGTSAANPALDQGGTTEFSSLVTVTNDDRSNSIVVSGTMDDIKLIQELIDQLDIVLAQVRIEVVIAEVTLDDNHQSGISQLGLEVSGDKLVGFSLAGGDTGSSITVGGSGNNTFASLTRNAANGNLDLAGIISLGTSPRKTNTTILTIPAIVTSHGKQAILSDGETRPVITGATTYTGASTPATSSQVTQQQIGTTLTVTPYIGNDGTVQLDIQTELSNVTDTVTVDGNTQYVIGTRKTNSYITAKSGDIIVMGGFRQEKDQKSNSRLGSIPIIGDLLGPRKKEVSHQELIFFLRPTVLTNNPAIDNAETMKQVEKLPTHEEIKSALDPNYVAPKKSILDKILRK
ncbi:MAG TPA: secretin N-terminal domain-containing protein [Opitutaceae bacterium]|nr:secretin N-terminal domain-containing protein [Opitutaceae bacterium]